MIEFISLFPVYVTDNLAALKSFYSAIFGFQAVFFDPEFYLHLQHPENGTQIGFLMPDHVTQPAFLHAQSQFEGHVLTFDVSDAKAALAAAEKAGLEILFPYTEEPWGQNHFMIKDPAGLILDIVEHVN